MAKFETLIVPRGLISYCSWFTLTKLKWHTWIQIDCIKCYEPCPESNPLREHTRSPNDDTVDCNNETVSTDNLEKDDKEPDLTDKTVALAGAVGENCRYRGCYCRGI